MRGNHLRFLLLRPKVHKIRRNDIRMQIEGWPCGTRPGHLLDQDGTVQKITAQATLRLRYVAAQKSQFPGLEPKRARHLPSLFPVGMKGRDMLLNEPSNGVAKSLVFRAKDDTLHQTGLQHGPPGAVNRATPALS